MFAAPRLNMKIRSKKDVEALELRIKNELGIDVQKYNQPEMVENLMDLVAFPNYVLKIMIGAIFISELAFALSYSLVELTGAEGFFYGLLGTILFTVNGFLMGLLWLTSNIKRDLIKTLEYLMSTARSGIDDLKTAKGNITSKNRKGATNLLFKGILHVVAIPVLVEDVAGGIPVFGFLVKNLVRRVLFMISDRIQVSEEALSADENSGDGESQLIDEGADRLSQSVDKMNRVLSVALRVVQFPVKMVAFVTLLLLALLILIVM